MFGRKRPSALKPVRNPHPDPVIEAQLRHIDTLEAHIAGRHDQMAQLRAEIGELGAQNASLIRRASQTSYPSLQKVWQSQIEYNTNRTEELGESITALEQANTADHEYIIAIRREIEQATHNMIWPAQGPSE